MLNDDDDDCNDALATVSPADTETCNSVDDNCDGSIDNSATDATTWYTDADGDTYGNAASTTVSCTQPSGTVSNDDDCNDLSALAKPGLSEVYGDGLDNDCDGTVDEYTYSYATNVQAIYNTSCTSCHGSSGGLSLSSSVSWANTVNKAAGELATMDRIEPGSTATSYLWNKISGTQAAVGGSGNTMPKGASALSATNLAIIQTWIVEGAPNN